MRFKRLAKLSKSALQTCKANCHRSQQGRLVVNGCQGCRRLQARPGLWTNFTLSKISWCVEDVAIIVRLL
jgi:hypothetical protein